MNNNCTCDVYPDYLMEKYWQVSCSCDKGGSQPMDDYYTKIQTDARIQRAKDDVENDIEGLARDIEAIETDIADTYSKEETDTKLSLKANLSDVYDKTATDGLLATKASTATTADLQAQINSKQDILVSGVNVKTLNGESLLGSGNISITGVTPEQVETMIDEAVSGKQDTSGMTAYTTTATTDSLSGTVTAHTSNQEIHVTAADKANWDAKVDQSDLDDYATTATVATKADITALTQVNGVLTAHTSDTVVHTTAAEKANWNSKLDQSALNGYATQQWVEGNGYLTGYTETDPIFTGSPAYTITNADKTNWNTVSTKADTTAVTQVNNALTAHTADTTVHTNSTEKATWNAKQDAISDLATIRSNASNAVSQLNGYSLLKISKSAFDALTVKSPTTIYLVYQD